MYARKTKSGSKLLSWLLSLVMVLSMLPTVAFAAEAPPAEIDACGTNLGSDFKLSFSDTAWLNAVTGVRVAETEYEEASSSFGVDQNNSYYVSIGNTIYDPSYILIGQGSVDSVAECVITAEGYSDLTLELDKRSHTAVIKETSGGSGDEAGGNEDVPNEKPEVTNPGFSNGNTFEPYYILTFSDTDYVSGIESVSVNGALCEEGSIASYIHGTQYFKNASDNKLYLANKAQLQGESTFQSGDMIAIKHPNYQDLVLKVIIANGTATIVPSNGEEGDEYTLYVRLVGSFEPALVGQEGYDAVSGASTNVSVNKNSNVEVQAALLPAEATPDDDDWTPLADSDILVDTKNTSVSITPEGSGMKGVYSSYDSSLTLAGIPETAGTYSISVTVADGQGRSGTSNALSFLVSDSDNVTLADRLILANCTQTADGKYMYDMEPWAISKFGGDDETVTVPQDIKAWYGSHTSGTYGKLGHAVGNDDAPAQTLIVPDGCDLTLVNMDILSSVKIVVENGGKLVLQDSAVQGIVEVRNGGTFSMNYDSYNGEFLSGASINGQLVLKDGARLENASIYSNTNFIANGTEVRHNTQPVVSVEGSVTLKGQVFIRGDEAPTGTDAATGKSYAGQSGLSVANGTLTLEGDAVLAVYAGGKDAATSVGGTAIRLNNGSIAGTGTLIAVGGDGTFDDGGNAVEGTGTISTSKAYLQAGYTFQPASGAAPGSAAAGHVNVTSPIQVLKNGEAYSSESDNPYIPRWAVGDTPGQATISEIVAYMTQGEVPVPTDPVYVLMNIPYADFYAAEKDQTDTVAGIDAISSATKSKPLGSLAAGSYHVNDDGSDITGIIYPVQVSDISVLSGYTQVTDTDKISYTTNNRGQMVTTEYVGKDALFGKPSYSYYILNDSDTPASYKVLSGSAGSFSFGKATGVHQNAANATATLATNGRHTYYEIEVTGLDSITTDIASKVSGVTLHTKDGNVYGLRHVYEIWRGTELGFDVTGENGDYAALQGKTIDKITYYLNDGHIYSLDVNLSVPKSSAAYSITVENALTSSRRTTFTAALPSDFEAAYTVEQNGTAQDNFLISGNIITWSNSPEKGAYTLTAVDAAGGYAPVSAAFELQADTVYAKYDDSAKKLVKANDSITDEDFQAYLKAISTVVVNNKSYTASGRGAVVIVKEDGSIDLTASPFAAPDGGPYQIVVKATGYQDLGFTLAAAVAGDSVVIDGMDVTGKVNLDALKGADGVYDFSKLDLSNTDLFPDGASGAYLVTIGEETQLVGCTTLKNWSGSWETWQKYIFPDAKTQAEFPYLEEVWEKAYASYIAAFVAAGIPEAQIKAMFPDVASLKAYWYGMTDTKGVAEISVTGDDTNGYTLTWLDTSGNALASDSYTMTGKVLKGLEGAKMYVFTADTLPVGSAYKYLVTMLPDMEGDTTTPIAAHYHFQFGSSLESLLKNGETYNKAEANVQDMKWYATMINANASVLSKYNVILGMHMAEKWSALPGSGSTGNSGGSGSSGSGSSGSYAVSVQSFVKNGHVSVSSQTAKKGDTVTITVKPNSGYELDTLTVTDSQGNKISLTKKSDTKYTFTMPASRVNVKAVFQEEEVPSHPGFTDVAADAYYADAIAWAVENGITNGTSAVTFSPNTICTRGQIVTFLWRAMGSPEPAGSTTSFTDVSTDAYYSKAVQWAVENGITQGVSTTAFAPNATVTRGQTVTFLWRAANRPSVSGSSFADVSGGAYYANAVAWAVSQGITQGTAATTFSPTDPCTRGQIVTFLYRYLDK